jgi:DHA2 family multidrug resistance protein-like MFS transporter
VNYGGHYQKKDNANRRRLAMTVSLQVQPADKASRARWWALAGITLGVVAVGLDVTVLSVALPTLATALKASESDLQWFSSAYAVVLAAAMLPAGVLGDRFGRKKVMVGALVLFGVASFACAYSPGPSAFIAARALLGAAAAAIVVMALSTTTVLFSKKELPRAVGVWAAANFLALPIGPILGGWLLANYWWGWVFLLNIPVAVIGLIAVVALVPESRAAQRPGLDPVGMACSVVGLVAVTYALIELGRDGWGDPASLGVLVAGIAVLAGFFAWERRLTTDPAGKPLIDLSLFESRSFTWGVILAGVGVFAMIGVLFTMPQYFQGVLGVDAQGSGYRLLPLVAGLVLGAVPADRFTSWAGAKVTVAVGFIVMAAGMALGATTTMGSSAAFVGLWMAMTGFGMGIALATAAASALSTVPSQKSGVASAMMQAVQKVGSPLGSAILGSVLVTSYQSRLHLSGLPAGVASVVRQSMFGGVAVAQKLHSPALLAAVRQGFVHGLDLSLFVSALIAVAAALAALFALPNRPAAPPEVTAQQPDATAETAPASTKS